MCIIEKFLCNSFPSTIFIHWVAIQFIHSLIYSPLQFLCRNVLIAFCWFPPNFYWIIVFVLISLASLCGVAVGGLTCLLENVLYNYSAVILMIIMLSTTLWVNVHTYLRNTMLMILRMLHVYTTTPAHTNNIKSIILNWLVIYKFNKLYNNMPGSERIMCVLLILYIIHLINISILYTPT